MRNRFTLLRWIALGGMATLAISAVAVYVPYQRDMQAIRNRVAAESQIAQTRHGPIEFMDWGSGSPVLVVHGAGGGCDQGRTIAEAFGGENFRCIAPSRFGYLRSPLPADSSTAAQADAFADLLDHIGVDRVGILAMSGGVPPSLQFAVRHPSRVSALVLLSTAPYTPLTASQQELPIPIWIYHAIFRSDFPYWVLLRVARPSLETMFDIKPNLRDKLTPREIAFVSQTMNDFLPVTMRMAGLQNEGAAIDPGAHHPIEAITQPTLVIHSQDDGINPFAFGEYTAEHIPGSTFLALPTGGHLLLGRQEEVQQQTAAFLSGHTSGGKP